MTSPSYHSTDIKENASKNILFTIDLTFVTHYHCGYSQSQPSKYLKKSKPKNLKKKLYKKKEYITTEFTLFGGKN